MIAVDRGGHYNNISKTTDKYTRLLDIHGCPYRGRELFDGFEGDAESEL